MSFIDFDIFLKIFVEFVNLLMTFIDFYFKRLFIEYCGLCKFIDGFYRLLF